MDATEDGGHEAAPPFDAAHVITPRAATYPFPLLLQFAKSAI